MRLFADFHIHSRFSRSCSKNLNLDNLETAARTKGVSILGTGDFTHPAWIKEIKNNLTETEKNSGLFRLKKRANDTVKFTLTTEVSLIYKDQVRVRRIHLVLHAPSLVSANALNAELSKKFNLHSDGRPILGMSAPDFVRLVKKIDPKFIIYPAHIWTPWFSALGSKSGFDSLAECFENEIIHIHSYETGLSSDPLMNSQVTMLDDYSVISNSDAHSLDNIGREANILEIDNVTYDKIYEALEVNDKTKLVGTIEFYPEEGMYHFDGHRTCGVCYDPVVSKENRGICKVCGKPVVVGVASRVAELSDRQVGNKTAVPMFNKIVSLDKIIAQTLKIKSRQSLRVQRIYLNMIEVLGPELEILLNSELKSIEAIAGKDVARSISRVRMGDVRLTSGYDGQYGEVRVC
ncbi:MAG: endonuclease Q family protein [bacterium]